MNVFVLLADSFRRDHLGFAGNNWIQTPNLDALAKDAFVFEQAYSGGLPTIPHRTECFTGRHMLKFRPWSRLQPTDELLSEALWGAGVDSALISDCWHLHQPGMAFARGFNTVRFIRGQEQDPRVCDELIEIDPLVHFKPRPDIANDPFAKTNEHFLKQAMIYGRNRAHFAKEEDHFCPQVVQEALSWLDARKGRDKLFLWLDAFDPHEPWDPPAPYNRMYQPDYQGEDMWLQVPGLVDGYLSDDELKHIRALYAGLCTMVDTWFGIFLNRLKELGFWDNSLILFTSDHGEFLGNGKWGHGQIRKGCIWPYEELAHIPLIVRHPGGIGGGQRSQALVQPCDLAPTILDFLGVEGLSKRHGASLLPLIRGEKPSVRDFAVSGKYGRNWCIRDKQWTYFLYHGNKDADWLMNVKAVADDKPSPSELFDRTKDPYELNNLIEQHPDEARRLDRELRAFMDSLT